MPVSQHQIQLWRAEFHRELTTQGLTATPQAVAAVMEMLKRTPVELSGDSDALLVGLLYAGSYPVDVLESAGVSARRLRALARGTAVGADTVVPPFEGFFRPQNASGLAVSLARDAKAPLETAHLLQAALSPVVEDTLSDPETPFPMELREHRAIQSTLQNELEAAVSDLVAFAVAYIAWPDQDMMLRRRTTAITEREDEHLDKEFGKDFKGMQTEELEFIIAAINQWFQNRRILTDPPDLCMRSLARCQQLKFGPNHFASAGGNLKSVDVALQTIRRLSPERDLGGLVLFQQDNRVQVGQYTYRNTLMVPRTSQSGRPFQHVNLRAIRPVSLVPSTAIEELEGLLSKDAVYERELQRFFEQNPAILEALGYASARPHLCLREDGKQVSKDRIPDFILELPGGRGFDILDLKLPSAVVAIHEPYLHVSAEVTKAHAQLRAYRKFFDNAKNRRAFIRQYGLEPFRPQLVVVIGRSNSFATANDRMELEDQVPGLKLLTYDDLLAYGRSRIVHLP